MADGPIDFWFTIGSTYSGLSVMRLADVERSTGMSFRWRPFHLLLILQEMKHVPFADKPAKCAYMWRDLARRAAMYGFAGRFPAPYPAKQSVAANQVAIVGMREGWGKDFARAPYSRWFQEAKRLEANQICRRACATSGKSRTGCSRWQKQPKQTTACWRKPTPPKGSEFSARPRSWSITNYSGATIA